MNLHFRIDMVGTSIGLLAKRLAEHGFQFERPANAFPGPEPGAASAIARIEREAGVLPLALKLFWLNVGSVDLCGSHPEWKGCDYPDSLMVWPPSVAAEELDEFLKDREERLRCDFPYRVPVALDLYHKENVSGGPWYSVDVPCVADDPPLKDEWHETTFVQYLEIAVKWGGFPGLARCPGHTWPVANLVCGILSAQ